MKSSLNAWIYLLVTLLASGGLHPAARAQAPTWDAAWTGGGAGAIWAFGTAADASGNVFACGRFAGFDVAFGTFALSNTATPAGTAPANQNGYLAKYSPSGTVLWVRQASVTGFSSFSSVATDAAGNVYACGLYSGGALALGGTTLPAPTAGPQPGFVAKYDPQGTLLWTRQLGSTSLAGAGSVAVSAGAVFVAGSFAGSLDVSGLPSLNTANTTADLDAYLVKFDAQGVPQWSRQAGGSSYDNGTAVAVDASGSPVLGGHFSSPTLTTGGVTLTNAAATVSTTSYDIFLVKYDGQGTQQWAQRAGGSGPQDRCNGLVAAPGGSLYLAGILDMAGGTVGGTNFGTTTGTGALLAAFAATGAGQWARREGGGSTFFSLALDPGNNLVVAGGMSGSLVMGSQTLTSAGGIDMLTARYAAAGVIIGAGRAGGNGNDYAYATCSDPSNGQTVVGYTTSSNINLGGGFTNFTNASQDAVLIRYAASGTVAFARRISSYGGNEYPNGTAVDAQGNTYVTGSFVNNIRLGSLLLTTGVSSARRDGFVVKYSPTGAVLWTRQLSNVSGSSLGLDAADNLYVAGNFTGSLTVGNSTLNSAGGSLDSDVFLVKYDPQGTALWARSAGGTNNEGIAAIAVNTAGQVAVAGSSNSATLTFGNQTVPVGTNVFSAFVARYDASGTAQWGRAFAGTGTNSYPFIDGLAVDAAGGVGIAGDFTDNITIGTVTFRTPTVNDYLPFIAKCSPSGAVQWARQATGANSFCEAAAFDPAGNLAVTVYLSGNTTLGAFTVAPPTNQTGFALAKYDAVGAIQWVRQSGGTASTAGNSLTADGAGNYYVGGSYGGGTATFGATALPTSGTFRPLAVRYDGQGMPQWAVTSASANTGYVQCLAVGPGGTLTMAGSYTSFLQLNSTVSVQASESQGTDIFVARLAGAVPLATAAPRTALPPLALYPNPAHGTATVALPASATPAILTLADALGREVRRFAAPAPGATQALLDLRGLPAGLYLLRAGEATGKLIIE